MNIESILTGKGSEVRTIRPEATIAEAVRRMRTAMDRGRARIDDGRR